MRRLLLASAATLALATTAQAVSSSAAYAETAKNRDRAAMTQWLNSCFVLLGDFASYTEGKDSAYNWAAFTGVLEQPTDHNGQAAMRAAPVRMDRTCVDLIDDYLNSYHDPHNYKRGKDVFGGHQYDWSGYVAHRQSPVSLAYEWQQSSLPDGQIADAIEAGAALPPEDRTPAERTAFDAYVIKYHIHTEPEAPDGRR